KGDSLPNCLRWVRFPQGTLVCIRGSANGRLPGFEPGDEGSNPSPRTELFRESANGKPSGSDPENEGSTPSSRTVGKGPDTPTGRAARLKPESVWVRLPLWAPDDCRFSIAENARINLQSKISNRKSICLRGAAWSARLPVTQEIVGSNPIGGAWLARYANR